MNSPHTVALVNLRGSVPIEDVREALRLAERRDPVNPSISASNASLTAPRNLKDRIVRNPISGRIFLVEKLSGTHATLRRLDREAREQARIHRLVEEVEAWEVLEPRSKRGEALQEACQAALKAWNAWPKPEPDVEYLIPGADPSLNHLAELVAEA